MWHIWLIPHASVLCFNHEQPNKPITWYKKSSSKLLMPRRQYLAQCTAQSESKMQRGTKHHGTVHGTRGSDGIPKYFPLSANRTRRWTVYRRRRKTRLTCHLKAASQVCIPLRGKVLLAPARRQGCVSPAHTHPNKVSQLLWKKSQLCTAQPLQGTHQQCRGRACSMLCSLPL